MAPTKEKSKKASADEGAALVLEYLRKPNRPYSAIDVSANLHNKVTKTNAAKLLKDLHERKEIEGRVSGKRVVYHVLQPPYPASNDTSTTTDLSALESRLTELKSHLPTLRTKKKQLEAELSSLSGTSRRSTAELQEALAALQVQKMGLKERIGPLKSQHQGQDKGADVKPVTQEEKEKLEKDEKIWTKIKKERAEVLKNVWEVVLDFEGMRASEEGVSVGKQELWDELGCEGKMPRLS